MEQLLWKVAQVAVFGGLAFFLYEVVGERQNSMLAALIIALALTAVIFAPFLHLKAWLERRRDRETVQAPPKQPKSLPFERR